jgi:hypothetical protein
MLFVRALILVTGPPLAGGGPRPSPKGSREDAPLLQTCR